MKPFFVCVVTCFLAFAPALHAQEKGAVDRYFDIYAQILNADTQTAHGKIEQARTNYLQAQTGLRKLLEEYPTFNVKVVKFRLNYVAGKISALPPAPKKSSASMSGGADDVVITPAHPDQPVELKVRWQVGKRYLLRTETTAKAEIKQPGQALVSQNQQQTETRAISVLKERDGGGAELELEFLPPPADAPKSTGDLSQKLAGSRVKYLVDARGNVESVEGYDEFLARLSEGAPAATQATYARVFTKESLIEMVDDSKQLPDHPVKVGDTWTEKSDVHLPGLSSVVANMSYTFKGWVKHLQHDCVLVEFSGKISAKPSNDKDDLLAGLTIDPGIVSGKAWFDPALGTTIESSSNDDLTIKLGSGQQIMSTRQNQISDTKLVELTDLAK